MTFKDFQMCCIFLGISTIITQIIFVKTSSDVEVFIDKKLVYKGPDACVRIRSAGSSSLIEITKYFCTIVDRSYVSKDVVVKMDSEDN